jgi:phytoene synthase
MTGASDMLDADRQVCARQARAADRERFLCSLFAAEPARGDLWALLAFNDEIARTRETVSEPTLGEIRLQWWREAVEAAYDAAPRPHPVVRALAAAIARTNPPRDRFERLLHARLHDLYDDPMPDLAALEDYADATSGELAALELDLLGVDDAATHLAARQIGIAWALVGLVRATPFLAGRRRLLLPADLLAAAGVDAGAVFEGRPGAGLRTVLRAVADRAAQLLRDARARRVDVRPAALPALLPARLADRHLQLLAASDFEVFTAMPQPNPATTTARLWWAHARRRY